MAEAIVAQVGFAALGAAIGEVLGLIKEVKDNIIRFKPELERLESTLKNVRPELEKIKNSNIEITDTFRAEIDRLIAELKGAEKLVYDYTHPRKRDVLKKIVVGEISMVKKILEVLSNVNESVDRFFQVYVVMEILEKTMGIEERVESLRGKFGRKMKIRMSVEFRVDIV